jgi:hypothetical protein
MEEGEFNECMAFEAAKIESLKESLPDDLISPD